MVGTVTGWEISPIAHTWVRMAHLTSNALFSAGEFTKEVSGCAAKISQDNLLLRNLSLASVSMSVMNIYVLST